MPAQREPTLIASRCFEFLGETRSLDAVGWDGPGPEKLWRYNQHYFDDLNAKGCGERTEWHLDLLQHWLEANPPGKGNGWEPYPLSLRVVNWIKWALSGYPLPAGCIQSLAVQARWLTRRLEVHLLGNHLFSNAKALVFCGLFFEGPEADAWFRLGLSVLQAQVREQVLSDGGQFERSTMYHALALEDVLDLINLLECQGASLQQLLHESCARFRQTATGMIDWLDTMCQPDGEISFFNDAAFGIAATPADLRAYAGRLNIVRPTTEPTRSRWLQPSGYVRLEASDAVALLDIAPIGPDYLPGHAHADTLSFELSVGAHRVLVNSGTSCYGSSGERLRQRGTAAHNTVVIGGADSSEVWSGFRVARRALPKDATVHIGQDALSCEAAHDGYARLPGRPIHRRRWLLRDGQLTISDIIERSGAPAEARFHFHPDVAVVSDEGPANAGQVLLPDGRCIRWHVREGDARLEASTWHPRFGTTIPNRCLAVRLTHGRSKLTLSWR